MKHKTHQVSLAQCQSLKNILYVWESKNENCKSKNPKVTRFDGPLEESLNQNLGKGPPGRARSPGFFRPVRTEIHDEVRSKGNTIHTEFLHLNTNLYSNFTNIKFYLS